VAGLARTSGANELFEIFARYGCRDFRSIGHKASYVANGWRTLQCIGWQHAEPVLRSLTYALLNHEGEPNPAENDLAPDRPWRRNRELAAKIRNGWQAGKADQEATGELLVTLREASDAEASVKVVQLLNRGVSPQSVYDALFIGAGELLMRQPGIVALHAVTSTNALHFAYQTATSDQTRRLLLLQNASFLPLFRQAMHGRGEVGQLQIDLLEPIALEGDHAQASLEIFGDVSQNRTQAASKVLAYLADQGRARDLINAARRLVFLKGDDSHDYKFSSAALEDYYHVSPAWRDRFLASSMFSLRGAADRDNALVQRTRAAFQSG
jgi:hypothetical protein